MKQDSKGTYHDYEYNLKLKRKLSRNQQKNIGDAIKKSPLFHRTYNCDGNTWYELRSPNNQDLHKEPDANILIGADHLYIMRETESVWENLNDLKQCIGEDLEKVSNYVS